MRKRVYCMFPTDVRLSRRRDEDEQEPTTIARAAASADSSDELSHLLTYIIITAAFGGREKRGIFLRIFEKLYRPRV